MYLQSDFQKAKTALTRFVAIYATLCVLALAGVVTFLILRLAMPLYVLAGVFTVVTIFLWGIFGGRLRAFWRFLREMSVGRESEAQGGLASMDDHNSYKDGVEFLGLRLFVGDETDKQGGRLLYVDSSRLPLPVQIGQTVRVKLYRNYLKDIQPLEDK